MVPVAAAAAQELRARGIDCGVAHARFAKPLDLDLLREIARDVPRILTLEEHLSIGGFGTAVLEAFEENGLDSSGLRTHAIPDQFVEHSPQALQRRNLKLDPAGVVEVALLSFPELLRSSAAPPAKSRPNDADEKVAETVTW